MWVIDLRLARDGSYGVIEVSDQGVGVPAHEQERIVEKFYPLDPNMTKGVGNFGLGLYISRELVQRIGGRLAVTSQHGAGSTFTIILPLAKAQPTPRAQPQTAAADSTVASSR